jgi:hypothetical protein
MSGPAAVFPHILSDPRRTQAYRRVGVRTLMQYRLRHPFDHIGDRKIANALDDNSRVCSHATIPPELYQLTFAAHRSNRIGCAGCASGRARPIFGW